MNDVLSFQTPKGKSLMKKTLSIALLLTCMATMLMGCNQEVPPGHVGRVNTPNGWNDEILKPGRHTCYGRDTMYLVNATNQSFTEPMNILVGGKVNLKLDITVRTRANSEDKQQMLRTFDSVQANSKGLIDVQSMYTTFLKMKVLAIPRQVYEVQPDVATAVANSPKLALEVRRQITEAAKATPLIVEDVEISNYDWPQSITDAQEELVRIQLRESAAEAQVRADLKQAEGQLQVEEANKLVELKKAEAVSESIGIIKETLANSPEYLMWHQIRVMGEAAQGPNNCFILYPMATEPAQVRDMITNTNLRQMLSAKTQ